MLEVQTYLPVINIAVSSTLASWVIMDHNTTKNTVNGEQLRQESFVAAIGIVLTSVLSFLFYMMPENLYTFFSPLAAYGIFAAYSKIQPQEFGFWDRSKVKIAIMGATGMGFVSALFFGISGIFFPLFSALLIFNIHHKAVKSVSADNAKTMEALRKQAIFNQANFNNSQIKDQQDFEEETSKGDIFHIAG